MDMVNAAYAGAIFRKEKYPKKNPLDAARFLRFSHLPGFARKDIPALLANCGIPAAPLTGYSRQMLRCSARHKGLMGDRVCIAYLFER